MTNHKRSNHSKKQKTIGAMIGLALAGQALGLDTAYASDFNAGYVLDKMESKQQHAYLAGVIEGLAFSRYALDKPDETGMKCIYDWFYERSEKNLSKMLTILASNKEKPVGVLLYVLTKRDCGLE
jgi:hypothetical protein